MPTTTGDSPIEQAIILVGGAGTRLKPLTQDTPKPLLEVAGRPFVEYLLDALAAMGLREIILSCGHLGEQVQARYDNRQWGQAKVTCFVEPQPAGTAGALALLYEHLHEHFLLLNGDSILPFSYIALAKTLQTYLPDRLGVLTLTSAPQGARRYGGVRLGDDQLIEAFVSPGESAQWINAGVYAFAKTAFASCPHPSSLEQDWLPRLAAAGQLSGTVCTGNFIDIGIPEDYERAQLQVPQIAATMKQPVLGQT